MPHHFFYSLFFFFLLLLLPLPATLAIASTTPNPQSRAHCECRCCVRTTHYLPTCQPNVSTIPLPPPTTCIDSPFPSQQNQPCTPALCNAHFPSLCPSPTILLPVCISDTGTNWLPLIFAFTALIALAIAAASRMQTGPTTDRNAQGIEEQMAYKREPVPPATIPTENSSLLTHPPHHRQTPSFSLLEIGPKSPIASSATASLARISRSSSASEEPHSSNSPTHTHSLPATDPVISPLARPLTSTNASAPASLHPQHHHPRTFESPAVPPTQVDEHVT